MKNFFYYTVSVPLFIAFNKNLVPLQLCHNTSVNDIHYDGHPFFTFVP